MNYLNSIFIKYFFLKKPILPPLLNKRNSL